MATFYQVGGSVRDELLGIPSKDIDYAVETDSFEHMRSAILARGGEIFLETPQFLTIRARVPGLGACDYVLCRKDGIYSDGRRPETVEPGTIFDDLARRDFTINAIAKTESGEIIDPHGGRRDLESKLVRCVGKASERFTEDGLRMLRALRFKITKGFALDWHIIDCLMWTEFYEPRLEGVSIERIHDELLKCFRHDSTGTFFDLSWNYSSFIRFILNKGNLWLKPTLEKR